MRKKFLTALIFIHSLSYAAPPTNCTGKFVNPITDICWSCLFPLFIGPLPLVFNIGGQKGGTIISTDKDPSKKITTGIPLIKSGSLPGGMCTCAERSVIAPVGIMMSYQEPNRLVDVTRNPFCMVGLGGIDLSGGLSDILPAPNYGDEMRAGEIQSSFYQAHWYIDPIMAILGIIDTACTLGAQKSIDVLFMSEVDPSWNDDSLAIIFSPEVVLFSSLPAQLACGVDCIGASLPNTEKTHFVNFRGLNYADTPSATNTASAANPSRYMFWCGGCQGSLYPLNGNNVDNAWAVQSSILTAQKLNGFIHRLGLENMSTGQLGMCNTLYPDMFLDKSEWKYSISFPISQTAYSPKCCNAFGETDAAWNSGASFPYKGEDFNYVMYHERDCCFL